MCTMHFKQDAVIKLLLWSRLILWSCFKYQETPTKMDDFHILPVEQGWQDTIRFKEEGHRCSILKKLVSQLYLYTKKFIQSFPWAASEGSPPLTLGTPVYVITILQCSKGQENGLGYSGPVEFGPIGPKPNRLSSDTCPLRLVFFTH